MDISFDLINGIALGIEYVPATEDYDNTVIVDLLIVRILIQWS